MHKKRRNRILGVSCLVYLFLSSTYITDLRYRTKELEQRVDSLVEFNMEKLAKIEVMTEYLVRLVPVIEEERKRATRPNIKVVPRGN